MKKLFLFITVFGLSMLISCGGSDSNSSTKTFCECIEEGDSEETPDGCEWLEEKSEEEVGKLFLDAMKDCPDLLAELAELEDYEEDFEEEMEGDRIAQGGGFDGGDFIDYTENYEGQIFEWELGLTESIFSPKSLRDFQGKDVEFIKREYEEPEFPASANIMINIPENLKIPKAKFGDNLIVKFKCGGSLTEGNVALSVSRPKK